MLPLETFKDEYVLAVNSGIQCSLPFLSWSGFFGCPQASPILLSILQLYCVLSRAGEPVLQLLPNAIETCPEQV